MLGVGKSKGLLKCVAISVGRWNGRPACVVVMAWADRFAPRHFFSSCPRHWPSELLFTKEMRTLDRRRPSGRRWQCHVHHDTFTLHRSWDGSVSAESHNYIGHYYIAGAAVYLPRSITIETTMDLTPQSICRETCLQKSRLSITLYLGVDAPGFI